VKGNTITDTGALAISSGSKTGRVPKEKRIVLDEVTKDVSFCHLTCSAGH
jgi:phosphoenolpyruvate carboxykinase (ATP)